MKGELGMQIRCTNCQKPFALGTDQVHYALDLIHTEKLSHYNAKCPHCRRMNRVSQKELERDAPDWEPGKSQEESSEE
jgi:phage FluMu protein Com